jgi:CheY-like chemotaxis protein
MSRSQDLELKQMDINEQIRQLLRMARRILPETIEIDFIEGNGLPLVEADGAQMDQVFLNLLINARDAMPNGGHLTLETQQVLVNGRYAATHPWAKPGRYVLAAVTDTGIGMSREVQDRVFEPFFTTKGPRVGTGLGLAVVYGIVRQHRGMVHCYSEVSVGTTFKIYLPAMEQLATDVGTKIQRQPTGGAERVLVAEDDEYVRMVAVKLLERAGYAVKAVEDGEAACRLATKEEFDLVVLDVVMPGLTCRDVVTRIAAVRPELPILLSSGYAAGANTAQLTQQTGLEILSKPYDPDRMLHAVRAALDSRRHRD